MSSNDDQYPHHSEADPQGSSLPKPFPKKRIRIPGIEDLVLPSSTNHPEDAQPIRKKAKKNAPSPGIVYISRLPPGMTHQKVKHILAGYGEIGRIYAQQKDGEFFGQELCACCAVRLNSLPSAPLATANNQSRKHKHTSANYTEAWVEFKDKKIAKVVAEMLNASTIGGKKGDRWRDDIWTMKYLSGFKWEMLGEQVGEYFSTAVVARSTVISLLTSLRCHH